MLVMNKYCTSKWTSESYRQARLIRSRKYRRLEELRLVSKSDSEDNHLQSKS